MKLRVGSAVLLVTSESQLPGSDDLTVGPITPGMSGGSYCLDAPNTSELSKIHCERLTVNRKLLKDLPR